MRAFEIQLASQIPSGKNQQERVYNKDIGRYMAIPNKRFELWRDEAGHEILSQKGKWPAAIRLRLPINVPLVAHISYRPLDQRVRDLPGMQDALWHLLEWSHTVLDDKFIKGVTWEYPYRTEGPCVMLRLELADERV